MTTKITAEALCILAAEDTIMGLIQTQQAGQIENITVDRVIEDMVGGQMVQDACNEHGVSVQMRAACVRFLVNVWDWYDTDAVVATQVSSPRNSFKANPRSSMLRDMRSELKR